MAARRNKPSDTSTTMTHNDTNTNGSSTKSAVSSNGTSSSSSAKPSASGMPTSDKWSLALLFLLYTLQGIPLGLSGSLPMLLSQKNISFSQQALFSLVSWPFSLKVRSHHIIRHRPR
jgi:PAT family acetyl-CoA transporter-like MFS transporter 1